MRTFMGIDPGVSGAMSVIYEDGKTESIPFDKSMYQVMLIRMSSKDCFCVMEQVSAMPKQGVTSTFTFGTNFGYLQGLLEAYNIPYQLVRPQVWKKHYGCTSDKNTSLDVCRRLFPEANLKRTERSRKDDDNIAESLLLAEYGRRLHGR